MRVRLVAARANLIALSTASAPELVKKAARLPGAPGRRAARPGPAREEGAVHLHEVREVGVESGVERLHDGGMPPAQGEDPQPGQEIEVSVPFVVDEMATLAPDVEAVELENAEHPGQLGIDVLGVEGEVLALAFVQHLLEIKTACSGFQAVALRWSRQITGGTDQHDSPTTRSAR
jgi:hypothetical protein